MFVRYRNLHFRQRNQNHARVDFVLGEMYWKVEVGETVWAEDYEHGRELVSVEKTANEINWSHGVVIPVQVVSQAFGYVPKASAYGAAPAYGGYSGGTSGGGSNAMAIVIVVVVLILIFAASACGACGEGGGSGSSGFSTSTGGIRSGSSGGGGFGGK